MTLGVVKISKLVHGNITGLRKIQLQKLEEFYGLNVPPSQIASIELIQAMCILTEQIGREIAVHMNRRGLVVEVIVGDGNTVPLSMQTTKRSSEGLCGIRCIHTHPSGGGQLSSVDLSALVLLKLDIMVAIGVKQGQPDEICYAYLRPEQGLLGNNYLLSETLNLEQATKVNVNDIIREIEKGLKQGCIKVAEATKPEIAILIGLDLLTRNKHQSSGENLAELHDLANTAGAIIVNKIIQKRQRPDASNYIGFGKLEEIRLLAQVQQANVIITNDELSPAQQRNLENILNLKVIDRTGLILDIFAQRAHTKEGKLQVELAQLHYLLPRLIGTGTALSRLGGGIGTRGPGETKLESDRRRIRQRIRDLERELEQVRQHRERLRRPREKGKLAVIALVGYTNAGKSSLMNAFTNAEVLAEDKLFATLDPTTRKVELPSGKSFLLTDTVGFIRKLPHQLVHAFRATLEETVAADILLHVIDASNPQFIEQMKTVEHVLAELSAQDIPTILVFNKMDLIKDDTIVRHVAKEYPFTIFLSAATGQGIPELINLLIQQMPGDLIRCDLLLPYEVGTLLSLIHSTGQILSEEYLAEGVKILVDLDSQTLSKVKPYLNNQGERQ